MGVAFEQVQEDVGPELVEGAGLATGFEALSQAGDLAHRRRYPVWG